jgi:transposase
MAAEIISTVERRRNWPTEVKLRIMEEAVAPGACIAAVADRNGVCRSLLYSWLRLARDDKMPGISITPQSTASFLPVRIEPPAKAPAPPAKPDVDPPAPPRVSSHGRRVMSKTCLRHGAQVEIALTNGRVIKVDECIDPAALALLVAALDGGAR